MEESVVITVFGEFATALSGKALIGAAAWFVVGPAMAVWMRKRTIGALEDMLENAVVLAKRNLL